MSQARILIAGVKSGSGKTTVVCALLQMMKERGLSLTSLKCGPDFIDPMFHREIIGVEAGNIDAFFLNEAQLRQMVYERASTHQLTVMEGVMGYYDGIGFTNEASSYAIAKTTKTPALLVLPCKGMGASIKAMLNGYVSLEKDSQIKGVIFNELPASLYEEAKKMALSLGVTPLGYIRSMPEVLLESRHLGLVTATEVESLQEKLHRLAEECKKTLDIEGILKLAEEAEILQPEVEQPLCVGEVEQGKPEIRIAVAKDAAFCFLYQENLDLLERFGAKLVFFSPLNDATLPDQVHGLFLPGGYPELHAIALSENESMKQSIKNALQSGIPTIAECGGFLYLQEQISDLNGNFYPMVGYLKGEAIYTKKLQRFGYISITGKQDSLLSKKGREIVAHEFHYYDTTNNGTDYLARKKSNGVEWDCIHATKILHAGFPHLYFPADPEIPKRFLTACKQYQEKKGDMSYGNE